MRESAFLRYARAICIVLAVIGLAFIGGFFIRRALDRKQQLKMMEAYEKRMAELGEESDHHYVGGLDPDIKYVDGDTIAILRLDRLGIKVAVTQGTDKDALRVSAGHFNGGDMPGEGNFAIAGHSSLIYTCLFNKMHDAVVGDEIDVLSDTGKHRYVVSEIRVASPYETDVVEHTNESVLTIVTCTNNGKERLIIRGVEVV